MSTGHIHGTYCTCSIQDICRADTWSLVHTFLTTPFVNTPEMMLSLEEQYFSLQIRNPRPVHQITAWESPTWN